MPTTPARDPRDQPLDPPPPPAAPSVRDLLASCAAARTVSTPPRYERAAAPRMPAAADRDAA